MSAPLFKPSEAAIDDEVSEQPAASSPAVNELAMALISLLKPEKNNGTSPTRPAWDHRRALVCTAEKHREQIARRLTENRYQVFIAEHTEQAIERMRESRLDVVILDPDFDLVEQGPAFVTREVSVLRPVERRKLFFVLLSSSLRTMDAHAAFLNNVNLVVNFSGLADLPDVLERAIREYDELYQDFNAVLNVAPL